MNTSKPREETILAEALAFTSAEARQAYLHGACGDNRTLRSQVESLIAAHEAAGQFLADSQRPDSPTLLESPAILEGPGTRIGRYKLLQQIGEGGMGVVYMAEQEEPVRRRVALKIIKLGMDTRQVVARFEAERQALAMMDHPNIARVLDGGTTDTGRPYFVMELVQGVAMTEFCDRNRLPAKERLQLFTTVCQAVQHAHQKGIIHRDIKPSNVLVTLHDGVPVPKVIDFGIAKATNQKLTEKTLFTNFATMIGTPAYMSPEQAEMSGLDVDTRTDIYALGVLLYQLLTGTTPFPEKRLRSLAYGEMQRVIVEEEPQRPSTRLSTMANEERTVVAGNCGEELEALSRRLKGDLDWIVMRCLEKDRTRRYETANGLANDIQRHLDNEPVMARPPSTAYRFQKLVRRNRGTVLAVAVIAMTLVGALGFSTSAYLKEKAARRQAALAELAREAARRATEQESIRADAVNGFVESLLQQVVPTLAERGQKDAVRRVLEIVDRVASKLTNAPKAESQIRLHVGGSYGGTLWDFSESERQFVLMGQRSSELGSESAHFVNLARSFQTAARLWRTLDLNLVSELTRIAQEAASQHPPDIAVAGAAAESLCLYYSFFGRTNEAETAALEFLQIAPDDVTPPYGLGTALAIAATEKAKRGALLEADKLAERLISTVKWNNEEFHQYSLDAFVEVASAGGRYEEASRRLQRVLDRLLPHQDLARMRVREQLGALILRNGDWKRASDILGSCVANPYASLDNWQSMILLASLLGNQKTQRDLVFRGLARFGSGSDPQTCRVLAEGLLHGPVEASTVPLLEELLLHAQSGPDWTRAETLLPQAMLHYRAGNYEEAIRVANEYVRQMGNVGFKASRDAANACGCFVRSCAESRMGKAPMAAESYQKGLNLIANYPVREGSAFPHALSTWQLWSGAELLRREAAELIKAGLPSH